MDTEELIPIICGCIAIAIILGLVGLVLFRIVKRLVLFIFSPAHLVAISVPLFAIAYFKESPPFSIAAVLVIVLAVVVQVLRGLCRPQLQQVTIEVQGVEPPRRRSSIFRKKPPEATPDMFKALCKSQTKIETPAQDAALDCAIKKVMNSRNYSDWSLSTFETYWEPATQKQIDFLLSLGFKGKPPKYLGEASNFITAMQMVREYLSLMELVATDPGHIA